jgi:hypothetical protein
LVRRGEARQMAEPAQGWQPIETAPKDGTLVLLAYDTGPGVLQWGMSLARIRGDHWATDINSQLHFVPTHWMPLPEPPA